MLDFPLWKRIWLWALTLFFALAAVPSLLVLGGIHLPAALPSPMVNLGLDLAGGSHLMLEADLRQVAPQRRLLGRGREALVHARGSEAGRCRARADRAADQRRRRHRPARLDDRDRR